MINIQMCSPVEKVGWTFQSWLVCPKNDTTPAQEEKAVTVLGPSKEKCFPDLSGRQHRLLQETR